MSEICKILRVGDPGYLAREEIKIMKNKTKIKLKDFTHCRWLWRLNRRLWNIRQCDIPVHDWILNRATVYAR